MPKLLQENKELQQENYFQLYRTMGNARSLRRLEEATGLSLTSLHRMSVKYGWQQRLNEEADRLASLVKAQYEEKEYSSAATRVSLADTIFKKLEDSVGDLSISSFKDAKTALEMYALLTGKPTAITQDVSSLPVETLTDEELEKLAALLVSD
ncbi:hypothetical protein [Deinococcus aquaticus]|uniref:Terminase small subunit n=1 Tax=Deinococcus aquaticus TaxID=328692 RepID=A0ABY7UZ00_9DEIO|nr:hypothetical protein [Deinococcus aquaticus]WDA58156.1 hypothetical protein M8445_12475 [Deinococcus aquaticus]